MYAEQLPPVDTWLSFQLMNAVGISPGSAGPNQVWDFSDYEANGTTEYLSYLLADSRAAAKPAW